jgi:pSer/pThr/pTyr-binding forkhead associated (FHA) protein
MNIENLLIDCIEGPSKGSSFEINSTTIKIGRDSLNEIFIDDEGLSKIHFVLEWHDNVLSMYDNDSSNGVWLNGDEISEATLDVGSVIEAGNSTFVISQTLHKTALTKIVPLSKRKSFDLKTRNRTNRARQEKSTTERPAQEKQINNKLKPILISVLAFFVLAALVLIFSLNLKGNKETEQGIEIAVANDNTEVQEELRSSELALNENSNYQIIKVQETKSKKLSKDGSSINKSPQKLLPKTLDKEKVVQVKPRPLSHDLPEIGKDGLFPKVFLAGGGDRPLTGAFNGNKTLPWKKIAGDLKFHDVDLKIKAAKYGLLLDQCSLFLVIKNEKSEFLFSMEANSRDFIKVKIKENLIEINGYIGYYGKFHKEINAKNLHPKEPILISLRPYDISAKYIGLDRGGKISSGIFRNSYLKVNGLHQTSLLPHPRKDPLPKMKTSIDRLFTPKYYSFMRMPGIKQFKGRVGELRIYQELNEKQQVHIENELIKYWSIKGPAKNHLGKTVLSGSKSKSQDIFLNSFPAPELQGGGQRPLRAAFTKIKSLNIYKRPPFWRRLRGKSTLNKECRLDRHSVFLIIKSRTNSFGLFAKSSKKNDDFTNITIEKKGIRINGKTDSGGKFHQLIKCDIVENEPLLLSFRPNGKSCIVRVNGQFSGTVPSSLNVRQFGSAYAAQGPFSNYSDFIKERQFGYGSYTDNAKGDFDGDFGEFRAYPALNEKQQTFIEKELIEYWKLKGSRNGFEVGYHHNPTSGSNHVREFTSGDLTLYSLKSNTSKVFIGQSELIRWSSPESLPNVNLRAKHTWRLQNEIIKSGQQLYFSFNKKIVSQLPVNKGYYVLLYKKDIDDDFTVLAETSVNKNERIVFPQTKAANGYYTLAIKGEDYSSHPNTLLINDNKSEGIIELKAGTQMKITTSTRHTAFIRIYEKISGVLWYEGLSSKLNLSSRLIRNGDIQFIVEYAAQPGFMFTRYQFTIRSINTGGFYSGLKARFILASGLPKDDNFIYSRGSQATSLKDKVYNTYPAFRSAESSQTRDGNGNFTIPNYFHRPIVSFNTSTRNLVDGVAVSISGKVIIEKDGWYKFRARSALAMKLTINEKTRTAPKAKKGRTLNNVELTFKLKRGLHDFNLTIAGGTKRNLQVDWIGPGDKSYKELKGDNCLYLVSSEVEKAYSKFSPHSINHKTNLGYQAAFANKNLYIEDKALDDLVESYRTVIGFSQGVEDLHKIWLSEPHRTSNVDIAKKILTLIQNRVKFLQKFPSQRIKKGSFVAKIDGGLMRLFQQLQGFIRKAIRHPSLQKQALSTYVSILWYANMISSRPFFGEVHSGTNDCYGMEHNFVLNVWRGASIWDNPIAYDHARSLMDHHFSFLPSSKQGIHADNIYSFHGVGSRHINMGGYGINWFSYVSQLVKVNWGTPWARTPRQLDRMAEQLLAWEWFFYKGAEAFSSSGRHVKHIGKLSSGNTNKYLSLPEESGLSRKVREQLKKQKIRLDTGAQLTGNRFFYRHLQMMHRRKDYYIDVRMSAPATSGNETYFGTQNGQTSFGDGVTTLLRHGDEYRSIHSDGLPQSLWRYRALPGTTQLDREEGISFVNEGKILSLGLDSHKGALRTGKGWRAGGVSDGELGHSAFEFNHNSTKARKFFAFTEDGMHVLANGIIGSSKAPKGSTYRTNINQCSLQKEVTILQTKKGEVNGETRTIAYDEEKEVRLPLDKACWIEHNGIGYIVYPRVGLKKSSLVIRTSKRTPINRLSKSMWESPTFATVAQMSEYRDACKGLLNQSTPRETMVLEIYIDHGDFPKGRGANCSYFVCMRPEKKKAEEWLKNPPVKVLSNTKTVQAVQDQGNGTIHAFFYKAGELKGPGYMSLITKQPASIMLRKKSRESSSRSTYKSEKSAPAPEGPWHLYAQDPLVNCTFDTKNMSDYLDLKIRFPNTGTLDTHKVKLPMTGHADPDDRYRGGITLKVFDDQ